MSGKNAQPMMVQFFVKSLDGSTRVLRMSPEACFSDAVKLALHTAPLSVLSQVHVNYRNKEVQLNQSLEEAGVSDLDTLHLVGRVRGTQGWLEAWALLVKIRECTHMALELCRAGMCWIGDSAQLQAWVQKFLKIVDADHCDGQCMTDCERETLGRIIVEEGGLVELAGHVLWTKRTRYGESSVIALRQCIMHIMQFCVHGKPTTVFHVAGPLFWLLHETPLLSPAHLMHPGGSQLRPEEATLIANALHGVLSHGPKIDTDLAVLLFGTLTQTIRKQLLLEDPQPEPLSPALVPPMGKFGFLWRMLFRCRGQDGEESVAAAPRTPPVPESRVLSSYQTDALRMCCTHLQTLGPALGVLLNRVQTAWVHCSASLNEQPPAGLIYAYIERAISTLPDDISDTDASLASAMMHVLATVAALTPQLQKRFIAFLSSHQALVDTLICKDLTCLRATRITLLQALCAFPSFAPRLTPKTQRRWIAVCFGRRKEEGFHVKVNRGAELLADTLEQLGYADPVELAGGLTVHFNNEEGAGPGLVREFYTLVSRALFDPAVALFIPSNSDHRRFHINPSSGINPGHVAYFALCGRVLGLALGNETPLGIRFSKILYDMLTGPAEVSNAHALLENVRDADPVLYKSCSRLLAMGEEELEAASLPFVCTVERLLGAPEEVELCEGGHDVLVTSANREVFVARKIVNQLVLPVEVQAAALARGLSDVMREGITVREFLLPLHNGDFAWEVDGYLSIEDWRAHTEYHGFAPTSRQVSWFWQCVEGFNLAQRRRLLFFATSIEFLPPAGFVALPSKFHLYKGDQCAGLPTAHTCFYQLVLPAYESLDAMRAQLTMVVRSDALEGFGMR